MFHSSDVGNEYTITVTTSFQQSPKAIIKEVVMLKEEERSDTPEMDIIKLEIGHENPIIFHGLDD